MACAGCGAGNLGSEAEPLVLGEPNDEPGIEVVFLSPLVPGASHGSRGWVTGTLVAPYLDADFLDLAPVETLGIMAEPDPAPAAAKRSTATTKTTDPPAGSEQGDPA